MINPVEDIQRNKPKMFDFTEEILPMMRAKAQGATDRFRGMAADFAGDIRDAISPLKGKTQITQKFGNHNPNLYEGITKGAKHLGIDLRAQEGSEVYAPASGNVTYGKDKNWGNYALMTLPDGSVVRFSHLSEVGQNGAVRAGQAIARTGSTGNSTGPHLDISVQRNGQYIDPLTLEWVRNSVDGQGGGGKGGGQTDNRWDERLSPQGREYADLFMSMIMGGTAAPTKFAPMVGSFSNATRSFNTLLPKAKAKIGTLTNKPMVIKEGDNVLEVFKRLLGR